jgi:GT2 family glycosyltransferase
MLKVAVVILNWNTCALLEKFLPVVIRNSGMEGARIYVADNGSTDNSVDFLLKNYSESIGLIRLDKNYGFAEGYNKALIQIEAEYFVLLNTDAEPSPDWLPPLVKIMDADQLTAACMPKIKAYQQAGFFEYAGAAGGFIDKYGYAFCQGRIFNSIENDYGQYDSPCKIFWASGACMIVRGPLFKIMGGFDPYFFAHMEEIDLCWRLKNRGYTIRYTPDSTVYHIGGATLSHGNPRKTYLNFRNNLFLLYKNLPQEYLGSVIIRRIFLDIIAAIRFLFSGALNDFTAVLKAHISFFKKYRSYNVFRKAERRFIMKTFHEEIYPGSIVKDYFFKKKYTFKALKWRP